MKFLTQLTRILLLYAASETFVRLTSLPIPGALLGMVLFAALLRGGIIKTGQVADACDFFLRDMSLFFIPPAVALLSGYQHLRGFVAAFLFTMIVTTVLVFAVTALVTAALLPRQPRASITRNPDVIAPRPPPPPKD